MRNLGYILVGLATGVFSGALGVGGALLATPLIRLLGVTPYLAVGTTVPSVLPSTITGAWTYAKAGLVDRRAALWTALTGSFAAVGGALTTRLINGHVLMLGTAAILFVLAVRLFPGRESPVEEVEKPRAHAAGWFALLGLVTGFMSGLLGIGGGFLMVPVFIKAFGMPIKVALGTSLAVICVTVIPNIGAQAYVGNIDWRIALLLSVGVIPGARAGALISIKTKDRTLGLVVAGSLAIVALGYAGFELAQLFS